MCIPSGLPSSPQNPTTTVQYGPQNITVVVQWGYPQSDGGAPVDNYTVTLVGPVLLSTTSVKENTTFTLAYNEEYTVSIVSIVATNCAGTGGTVSLNISAEGMDLHVHDDPFTLQSVVVTAKRCYLLDTLSSRMFRHLTLFVCLFFFLFFSPYKYSSGKLFNHPAITLAADKLKRQWLWEVYFWLIAIWQPKGQINHKS